MNLENDTAVDEFVWENKRKNREEGKCSFLEMEIFVRYSDF